MSFWTVSFLLALFGISVVRPYVGIAAFAALLPLETILPSSLVTGSSFLTSPIAVMGALAVGGAVCGLLVRGQLRPHAIWHDPIKLAGLLFIAWMFLTHPQVVWSGYGRNWLFTFIQLWALFVIVGIAVATPGQHEFLMVCFGVASMFSARVAIATGTLAEVRDLGVRTAGYAVGVNTSSRYFVVAVIFALYFVVHARVWWQKVLALGAAGYLMVGVVFTQSRGGILLGLLSVVLMPLMAARRNTRHVALTVGAILVVSYMVLPAGALDDITAWFSPAQAQTSARLDSLEDNVRYALWDAGLRIWHDNPIRGVGMGAFGPEAENYLPPDYLSLFYTLNTHSMFIGLLSQTGIVGLVLFSAMLWACVRRAVRLHFASGGRIGIAAVWAVVILVLVVGSLFKDDTAEKMLWLAMGMAASLVPPAKKRPVRAPLPLASFRTPGAPRTGRAALPPAARDVAMRRT